jgi:hypothetical protein
MRLINNLRGIDMEKKMVLVSKQELDRVLNDYKYYVEYNNAEYYKEDKVLDLEAINTLVKEIKEQTGRN